MGHKIAPEHRDTVRMDMRNLKSMIEDARDYGCGVEDADYMRGLLEAIIEATLGTNGLR